MINCLSIFLTFLTSVSLWGYQPPWETFKKGNLPYLSSIEGWCSFEKAEKMMDLIHAIQPEICVEIGVFGGSSIYPTALALAYQEKGTVYAIDPWSTEECLRGFKIDDPNYMWWSMVDLEKVYRGFLTMLERHRLTPFCTILRTTSQQAVSQFPNQSIDILHVDGNHTEDVSYTDIYLFFPKVKEGGYIWLDDLHWHTDGKMTLEKAFTFLAEKCEVVDSVDKGNCILLRKIKQ